MSKLLFEPVKHEYTVEGVKVPSVSEVTRFLSDQIYSGDVDKNILERAAERGTAVHEASAILDAKGSVEIDESMLGYIESYVSFVKERKPVWFNTEWAVHYDKVFAGTLDRYGEIDGKRVIVDLKTTSKITGKHIAVYEAAQNLYRKALEHNGYEVDEIYILNLKNDGTYELIFIPFDDTLADACLAMHAAMKRAKPRRRKKNG